MNKLNQVSFCFDQIVAETFRRKISQFVPVPTLEHRDHLRTGNTVQAVWRGSQTSEDRKTRWKGLKDPEGTESLLSGPRGPVQRKEGSFRVESLILHSCTFLGGVDVLLRFSRQPDSRCSLLSHICSCCRLFDPRVGENLPTPTKPATNLQNPSDKPDFSQSAWRSASVCCLGEVSPEVLTEGGGL